ncbi:hypothetical protein LXL04_020687 [Taraxacum kok-saghyz]
MRYGIHWLRNQVRSSIATEIKVRSKLIRYGILIPPSSFITLAKQNLQSEATLAVILYCLDRRHYHLNRHHRLEQPRKREPAVEQGRTRRNDIRGRDAGKTTCTSNRLAAREYMASEVADRERHRDKLPTGHLLRPRLLRRCDLHPLLLDARRPSRCRFKEILIWVLYSGEDEKDYWNMLRSQEKFQGNSKVMSIWLCLVMSIWLCLGPNMANVNLVTISAVDLNTYACERLSVEYRNNIRYGNPTIDFAMELWLRILLRQT